MSNTDSQGIEPIIVSQSALDALDPSHLMEQAVCLARVTPSGAVVLDYRSGDSKTVLVHHRLQGVDDAVFLIDDVVDALDSRTMPGGLARVFFKIFHTITESSRQQGIEHAVSIVIFCHDHLNVELRSGVRDLGENVWRITTLDTLRLQEVEVATDSPESYIGCLVCSASRGVNGEDAVVEGSIGDIKLPGAIEVVSGEPDAR